MVDLPGATTRVSETAAALARGLDVCCVIFPCKTSADIKPRLFGSADAMAAQHGYCEGVEYADLHTTRTRKSILGVGLPIDVEGAITREDVSGNTNTSTTTLAALTGGILAEHDGALKVLKGGVVGTAQIQLGLSLDGGFNFKTIRIGTGTSYTEALFNFSITLGAGSLTEGETVHTWHGTAPRSASADWITAREKLAERMQFFRTMLLIGDLQSDTEAQALLTQVEAYETANERFTLARASLRDRLPQAAMSRLRVRMTGTPTLTFTEVGGTGDTITRSSGSWITDGFAVNDLITVTGAVNGANNETAARIASLSATVITLDADDLVDEVATAGCTVTATPRLVFAEVGAGNDTITRSRGSWLVDGFRIGDLITITGSISNNVVGAAVVGVTATVLTLGPAVADDLAAETIGSYSVTLTAGQTKAAWLADLEEEYESIDDAPGISLGVGRARVQSSYTGWYMRRPAQWLVSAREYQHDIHIAPWRKDDGDLTASLDDINGDLTEWDDRIDGKAASAARFTSLRTWANGPSGVYVALSLTRASDSSQLVHTSKKVIANVVCGLVQLNTENAAIGVDVILNDDGTATQESLSVIANKVNAVLENEMLTNKQNEGQRASAVKFTPNADDVYTVPEPTMNTVTELLLNGTILKVNNKVNIRTAA